MNLARSSQASENDTSRYFDKEKNAWIVKVMPGGRYVTSKPKELIATVLGSCVAACIWDPVRQVGGMNHFMLPESDEGLWSGASLALRYGNHAMDDLINAILKAGGEKHRMKCKFFGGGHVTQGLNRIGDQNAKFAMEYAEAEQLDAVVFDLGGTKGRRILFDPLTGRAWRKMLDPRAGMAVVETERALSRKAPKKAPANNVELF